MTIVVGANFCFLLIGGTPFQKEKEYGPVKIGKKTYTVEIFAVGVSTFVFGICWLVAWFYFLITGWSSFMLQIDNLIFHVILQLVAAVALIVSGLGIFRQWNKSNEIFKTSMAILLSSVGIALVVYGPMGHGDSIFMYLFGMWTLAVGGFLSTGTYLLNRLMHGHEN
jgi:hypothetical protein